MVHNMIGQQIKDFSNSDTSKALPVPVLDIAAHAVASFEVCGIAGMVAEVVDLFPDSRSITLYGLATGCARHDHIGLLPDVHAGVSNDLPDALPGDPILGRKGSHGLQPGCVLFDDVNSFGLCESTSHCVPPIGYGLPLYITLWAQSQHNKQGT